MELGVVKNKEETNEWSIYQYIYIYIAYRIVFYYILGAQNIPLIPSGSASNPNWL